MKKRPVVSVIMPVFNAGDFLQQSIHSILSQSYPAIEFLIVDDCSTDNSRDIITDFANRFSVIKPIFLKRHRGDSAASNIAYKKAKGQFIARMDADDISHPARLEKQVAFLLSHPNVAVVGTQSSVIDKTNTIVGEKKFPTAHQDIFEKMGEVNPLLHPSCMFRKSCISSKKLYANAFSIGDDYFTFFKLIKTHLFANLPDMLHYYRIHSHNSSLKDPKKQFFVSLQIRYTAWKKLGYPFSLRHLFITLCQTAAVMLLPNSFIVPFYLLMRGVYKPHPLTWISNKFSFIKLPHFSLEG